MPLGPDALQIAACRDCNEPVDRSDMRNGRCADCDKLAASDDRLSHDATWKSVIDDLVAGDPPVLVVNYRAKTQAEAATHFEVEAGLLAARGYHPIGQSWSPGQWSRTAFLVAAVLAILVIGLVILAYLVVVKPEGTLTVTYERRNSAADNLRDTKICPFCAESIKAAATVCRYCRSPLLA